MLISVNCIRSHTSWYLLFRDLHMVIFVRLSLGQAAQIFHQAFHQTLSKFIFWFCPCCEYNILFKTCSQRVPVQLLRRCGACIKAHWSKQNQMTKGVISKARLTKYSNYLASQIWQIKPLCIWCCMVMNFRTITTNKFWNQR